MSEKENIKSKAMSNPVVLIEDPYGLKNLEISEAQNSSEAIHESPESLEADLLGTNDSDDTSGDMSEEEFDDELDGDSDEDSDSESDTESDEDAAADDFDIKDSDGQLESLARAMQEESSKQVTENVEVLESSVRDAQELATQLA